VNTDEYDAKLGKAIRECMERLAKRCLETGNPRQSEYVIAPDISPKFYDEDHPLVLPTSYLIHVSTRGPMSEMYGDG